MFYWSAIVTAPTIAFRVQGDTEVFDAKGLHISEVAHIGPGYLEEKDELFDKFSVTSATTLELLDIWIASVSEPRNPDSLQTRLDSWFHTVVADLNDVELQATEQYIGEGFPLKYDHLMYGRLDVKFVDQMCRRFCDSDLV